MEAKSNAKIVVMAHAKDERYEAMIVTLEAGHAAEISKLQERLDAAGTYETRPHRFFCLTES